MNKRTSFLLLLLISLVTGSALAVVYTTYESRHKLNELQGLERERNQLQVEWTRLLLEQSSLVAQGKVEETAVSRLDMAVPDLEQVVVLTSE